MFLAVRQLLRIEGLTKTKSLCTQLIEDALGRFMIGDKHQNRHLIISGHLGSGKRTSARLTVKVLEAMGVSGAIEEDLSRYALLEPPKTPLPPPPSGIIDDILEFEKVMAERIQQKQGSRCHPVKHYRVTGVILDNTATIEKLNLELAQANIDGQIIILTGDREVVDALVRERHRRSLHFRCHSAKDRRLCLRCCRRSRSLTTSGRPSPGASTCRT